MEQRLSRNAADAIARGGISTYRQNDELIKTEQEGRARIRHNPHQRLRVALSATILTVMMLVSAMSRHGPPVSTVVSIRSSHCFLQSDGRRSLDPRTGSKPPSMS